MSQSQARQRIGEVRLGEYVRAVLYTGLVWECWVGDRQYPPLAEQWKLYYEQERYGPADGDPGANMLADLAERFGGELTLDPYPADQEEPGLTY